MTAKKTPKAYNRAIVQGLEVWVFLFVLFAALSLAIFAYSSSARAADKARLDAFVQRAQAAEEWVNSVPTLPVVATPGVALQRAESCYWFGPCQWHELRGRTSGVSYHGPTMSIPIVGGIRYRIGAISPTIHRVTELQLIDTGTLYITNKRIFFDGGAKNSTLLYKSVVKVVLFDGGFEVEKQTGRSPFLMVSADAERVGAIAIRAHAEWVGGISDKEN